MTTARLERHKAVTRRGSERRAGCPVWLGWLGPLVVAATPSALGDPHLIDTLFIARDNALWVVGCHRPGALLLVLAAGLSSCRHKEVICAMAQSASVLNRMQPQVPTMAPRDTPLPP